MKRMREGELLKARAREEGFVKLAEQEGMETGLARRPGRAGMRPLSSEIKPQLTVDLASTERRWCNQLEADRHDLECAGINEVVKLAAAIARRVTKVARQRLIHRALVENLKEAMKLAVQAATDVRIVIQPSAAEKRLTNELPNVCKCIGRR